MHKNYKDKGHYGQAVKSSLLAFSHGDPFLVNVELKI
jgi:hypothetical protein